MRLLFAGTPDVAVPALRAVHAAGHDIVAVITRQDAPLGRKRVLTPSPVAVAAEELGLRVIKQNRLTAELEPELAALQPDLGVVVAYGGLIRDPLLSLPTHGWINAHFSLLPAWRGASPVQAGLIAGDTETGVSVFRLVPELDAGPLFARVPYPTQDQTAGELLARLAVEAGPILTRVIGDIAAGAEPREQQGEVTYAPKLSIADGRLDPTQGAAAVLARYRGVTPEPGAWLSVAGERLKVLDLAASDATGVDAGVITVQNKQVLLGTTSGALLLLRVQPAGRTAMAAADWWRGLGGVAQLLVDAIDDGGAA